MAELGLGMRRDVSLQRFPGALLIANPFAEAADGQNALQGPNLFFQLAFLNAYLVH